MIYPYRCPNCRVYEEVVKHHTEAGLPEKCPKCNTIMDRVWRGIYVAVPNMDGWNPGLGCAQRNVKDRLKQLKEDRVVVTQDKFGNKKKNVVKGVELHEIGNEKLKTKTVHNDYALSGKEMHEIGRIINE